jgi:Transposase
MSVRKAKTPEAPTPPPSQAAADLRRAARRAEQTRRDAEECARLASLPVKHEHACGIDVGDASHWACVEATPDGADTVREFPAHTPGLRQLVAWLRHCGVTTVALEATGVYAHVLFLTLLEAGLTVVMTAPQFARQIKGRPKTDRRDCQWIQRLHKHGLLPPVFQPDEATQALRDYVRQRANLVRLSGQHIQRMQKALGLMNLKLTGVLGDVTGVTGLKVIRAILAGERDPAQLARLRDRRCKHSAAEIATALDGRYRPEHLTELRCNLALWEKYQEVIGELDAVIAGQLRAMRRRAELPPLPPKPRARPQAARPGLRRAGGVVLRHRGGPDGHRGPRRGPRPDVGQRAGDRLHQVADGQALHLLAGAVPQLAEDRRQGQVEPDAPGQEPGGTRLAPGGLGADAEQELPGGLPAAAALAAGGAQGHHGAGA